MNPHRTTRPLHRASPAGFTLIELMVVIALIGILAGMGIGFLQHRGTDLEVASSVLRDQLRRAVASARSRQVPAQVSIEPDQDGQGGTVRALVLYPVGSWHMEEDTRLDDDLGLTTTLGGTLEPGRFGMARRPDPEGRGPLLDVPTNGVPAFDLHDGFALRVDLWIEEREEMVIAQLGTGFELRLSSDLFPRARLVGTEGGEMASTTVTLTGPDPIRTHRWVTLELLHDGDRAMLRVDGAEVDSATQSLPVLQTDRDHFTVSPGNMTVLGLVDSVSLWAYEYVPAERLPSTVQIAARPRIIRFDRDGDLVEPVQIVLTAGEEQRLYQVRPGGVLE